MNKIAINSILFILQPVCYIGLADLNDWLSSELAWLICLYEK